MSRPRHLAAATALAIWPLLAPSAAMAHGFGQRFDLPLPLRFWLIGAGASIVLSFLVTAVFVGDRNFGPGYPRYDLGRLALIRWAARLTPAVRALAVAIFVVAILAGFLGQQSAYSNIIVTLVWVSWWAGFAFVVALAGNFWDLVNPIRTLFAWGERLFPDRRVRVYPRWLGVWPAVLLFAAFAWCELVWTGRTVPRDLAWAIVGYTVLAWCGMAIWGRETWLRHGECFTVAFGVLARFAPIASARRDRPDERSSPASPRGGTTLELRPYGAGLLGGEAVPASLVVFVLLMLATVSLDGFLETPLFREIVQAINDRPALVRMLEAVAPGGLGAQQVLMTLMLVLALLIFVAAFLLTSATMAFVARRWARVGGPPVSVGETARGFVLTLVPIAVAYHLAHYVWFLATTGQFVIPLASDPFGFGWNLFGTADYRVDYGILGPYVFWYLIVTLIIVGHVIAVFLAHAEAMRLYPDRRSALLSQIPMVILMVGYTMMSLWILAQPITG